MWLILVTVMFFITGCSLEQPEKIQMVVSFAEDGDYLTMDQQEQFESLIEGFNKRAPNDFYMWTGKNVTDGNARRFNAVLAESGITGIFVDICKDGTLFIDSTWLEAYTIADELNDLNTNSFSRAMFFVDNCAIIVTGSKITVYNPNYDIFGGIQR